MRRCQAMNSPACQVPVPLYRAPARRRLLERLNPLLTIILAFWALWHCRHARPPDIAPIR
ncbi:hypothetical protein [Pseudomonas yangonensis]|uniref:hypothetical protein n=1 Tax=Pseudomonas yangonensis TaxID=2579922 RepID=UPI0015B3C586|nr:hypothetical protein [Pseudomonas yangonensis]